jgi:hypothetical protein
MVSSSKLCGTSTLECVLYAVSRFTCCSDCIHLLRLNGSSEYIQSFRKADALREMATQYVFATGVRGQGPGYG